MKRDVKITLREPLTAVSGVNGAPSYLQTRGVVRLGVDPASPAARRIADIEHAPREDGLVNLEADFLLLQPAAPFQGNRGLLCAAPNRGKAGLLPLMPPVLDSNQGPIPVSDGYLFKKGWSYLAAGWQWDVPRDQGAVGVNVPDCGPLPGQVCVTFRASADSADHALHEVVPGGSGRAETTALYPGVVGDPTAILRVRDGYDDPGRVVPRDRWEFSRVSDGQIVPDRNCLWLEGGFEEGRIYEVRFSTTRAPLAGAGLLALRDIVSWIRYDPASPLRFRPTRVLGVGIAQAGRFVRQFLHDGMNHDDQGRAVFDGVFTWSAGGRRGEFNTRHAAPGVVDTYSEAMNAPPHGTADLLDRQRSVGSVPKVIFANPSGDYWRGDASLTHIDPVAGVDREEPEEARHYMIAGMDHYGALPVAATMNLENGSCLTEPTWFHRALVEILDQWVTGDAEPPPSQVPRIADCSAASTAQVLDVFGQLGIPVPDADGLAPPTLGDRLPVYVSAVDDIGTEIAGVAPPQVRATPTGIYAGWNVFRTPKGRVRMCPVGLGSFVPYSSDEIQARYENRQEVERLARTAAEGLVGERMLLPEDLDAAVAAALSRYDVAVAPRGDRN